MATEILRPDADGDDVSWTATGAANDWDCVDESVADENTTYLAISTDSGVSDELVNLAGSAIGSSAQINSVTITLRALHNLVQPVVNFLWKENSVKTVGAALALTTSYADYTEVRAVRPSDGAAWELADLNSLQVGARYTGDVLTGGVRLTQAFITVDYSLQAGRKSLLGVGR